MQPPTMNADGGLVGCLVERLTTRVCTKAGQDSKAPIEQSLCLNHACAGANIPLLLP